MIGAVDPSDRDRVVEALADRFGIDRALLESFSFYAPADERVVAGPPEVPEPLDPVIGGLAVARLHGQVKPTTDFLQAYGRHVTRNAVVLGREAARAFVAREDLAVDRDDVDIGAGEDEEETTDGWVLVRYRDDRDGRVFELGCGLLKEGTLRSVVPKGRSVELAHW